MRGFKMAYQNQDMVTKLQEIEAELDYRLNEGNCFSEGEIKEINRIADSLKLTMDSLLPLQIVRA